MKALLIGVLLASPPVAALALRGQEPNTQTAPNQELDVILDGSAVQMPVEIITKGSDSQWVYVEISNQSVPEPSVTLLIPFAGLLLLRRKRTEEK